MADLDFNYQSFPTTQYHCMPLRCQIVLVQVVDGYLFLPPILSFVENKLRIKQWGSF